MALDSSSTLADALGQWNDNLVWEGDAAKARLALEAVRWLLVNRQQSISDQAIRLDYVDLQAQEKRLAQYVGSVGNSARSSFTRGRMKLW